MTEVNQSQLCFDTPSVQHDNLWEPSVDILHPLGADKMVRPCCCFVVVPCTLPLLWV
jgi:hypothetical protein